jgi:hypothetical protein
MAAELLVLVGLAELQLAALLIPLERLVLLVLLQMVEMAEQELMAEPGELVESVLLTLECQV